MTSRHSILVLAIALLIGSLGVRVWGGAQDQYSDLVDANGNIRRPPDYRDRYQGLRTYMVLDSKGNEMHFTYASPGTAEFYRKNGRFADGRRDPSSSPISRAARVSSPLRSSSW